MNETMGTIGFEHITKKAQGLDHRVRTTDKAREPIRVRIRTILTRTTMGPIAGDHVMGESQWRTRPGGLTD